MLGKTYDSQICSLARALELVGERWSLLILRDATFANVTRFGDFQHNLGIATNVLAARLDSFVAAGIMRVDQGEYLLTEKGRDLAPAMVALTEWGDRWAAPGERPIIYHHAACGGELVVETRCQTHGPVPPEEIAVRPGPGMPADYLADRRPSRALA
jgi:DNA-binding HxlR family transcriptional regulator